MQRTCVVMVTGIGLFLSLHQIGHAQTGNNHFSLQKMEAKMISVTCNKTTNLVFPYKVTVADIGSRDILAQTVQGVENVVQLKAGKPAFQPTNLSVFTTNGKLYSFEVRYKKNPDTLNFVVEDKQQPAQHQPVLLSNLPTSEDILQAEAHNVSGKRSFLHKRRCADKMCITLNSVYLNNQRLWLTLSFRNASFIDYKGQKVRFFVRDRKRAKRTAVQETELQPLYSTQPNTKGKQTQKLAFAFSPFTVPASKELVIQVSDDNGGRSLTLVVPHRKLLRARLLHEQ